MLNNLPTDSPWIIEDFQPTGYHSNPPPPRMPFVSTSTTELWIQFELYGNQFRFRSADQATRKSKPKDTIK
ncbi:hypothetical protein BS47DRAFT_1340885 [Hydnum rufescens UP504]|uniref:Uncharacterized protein n=1 Tax=Hydnum rufescens UP504 TaxID=1448309 RepID=A0A9P6DZT0_9AGAM|nr:hypothetical protein BS47DRAFT_1340885 [Hydnum rufescens UP504]